MVLTIVTSVAEQCANALLLKLQPDIPNIASVVVSTKPDEIPVLIVMLTGHGVSQLIPKRFRGMRVITCLLPPRRR